MRVAGLPQFELMRRLVARRSLDGLREGRILDVGSGAGQLAIEMAARQITTGPFWLTVENPTKEAPPILLDRRG